MFTTLKQRIILGVYIFVIISIPIGAYLASQATQLSSKASGSKIVTKEPKSATDSAKALQQLANSEGYFGKSLSSPRPEDDQPLAGATTLATSYGPTLSLKVHIDGRPLANQASRLFIGIISGTNTQNPQYLLSFTVDLPSSGTFENLSLAGLTVGSTYSAVLKGDAQIATSSAFVMNPSITNLNSGLPLVMLSGDLNQDNTTNATDLQIAQNAFGSTPNSSKWNASADLNKDGIVNNLDISIINKNIGQIGATGVWYSTPPSKIATPSGSLAQDSNPVPSGTGAGSPDDSSSGYWVWVPK